MQDVDISGILIGVALDPTPVLLRNGPYNLSRPSAGAFILYQSINSHLHGSKIQPSIKVPSQHDAASREHDTAFPGTLHRS